MRKILVLVLALSVTVFATAQDLRSTPAARAACGPPQVQFKVDLSTPAPAVPSSGKALIYFVQRNDMDGSCLGNCGPIIKVGMDGNWIGATHGSSFMVTSAESGVHHLCTEWDLRHDKGRQFVSLNLLTVEPNKIYFFAINTLAIAPQSGGEVQFSLTQMNEDEGRMLISAYPESHATPK